MNSRADPGDSFFRAPLENQTPQEFQFMGSWIPVTPRKPLLSSSNRIVDERGVNQAEMPFCNNGGMQDLNYVVQGVDQSGVYDHGGAHQGMVTNRNRIINNLAGSYAQVRVNSERDLLGGSNAASLLPPVMRNTAGSVEPFSGNFTSDAHAGMVVNGSFTQSDSSLAGFTGFELDDLLDTDQMPFSFTSLLSGGDNLFQATQYGTPACSRPLYNLNSPPTREAVGSVCESSFQSVPATPSLRRTGQENGFLETMITTTGHEITGEKPDKSIVDSSVVNSTEVIEQQDGCGQNDLGFDLNKTPQLKTSKRRKKFLPKVVVEGKPKRKPRKPATQGDVIPKESGSGKRKKGQKTNLKESATKKPAIDGDMNKPIPKAKRKSCRKALDFDLEKAGDVGLGDSESEIVQNASGSNSFSETRDATGGTTGSCLDSVTLMEQTNGLMATNQPLEALMGNQPLEASMGNQLLEASMGNQPPRVSEERHTQIQARDQQAELLTGNQQCQFPVVNQNTQFPMGNQLLEASMGNQPPRVSEERHTWIQARDQQAELLTGNQQCQLPVVNQNTQFPMGNQQAWLQMKNQLIGFPFSNQQPRMIMTNQQPHLAMGSQQPMYLMGSARPALASGNQQPGGVQGNRRPIFLNQQMQPTCLPAGNQQYGASRGMQQLVVSTGGQQHGLLMKNQQPGFLLRNQQPGLPMISQQPGSSIRSRQPCLPLMNNQPGTRSGFTHLNQMAAACMPSPGLRPHSQSQAPVTNLLVESVSRSLIGTAAACQRNSIPEYGSSQQDIHQGNGYIPFQGRSQNSSLPIPIMAQLVEARGSKRLYDRAMGEMQNHDLNSVDRWPLLQQIAQSQDVERQSAEYLDAAKKMKVQKSVQEKLHGMPPEVIQIEDDPTDGVRKDKNTASTDESASKGIPSLGQNSADNEKCIVPKTPAKKGRPGRKKSVPPKDPAGKKKSVTPKVPAGRKKSVPPPTHGSEIQLWEPTLPKTPSSRNKAKEKGKKSIQDSGKSRGPSGELLSEDSIAEIIYRLQNIYLGDRSREEEQNALVLYKGDGAVVPYEAKKRKPRPKVDLDDETTRIWNLLMGKGESDEEMDKKKEKWWEEERRVFRGRADSFIARMHLVQGDRRFSPWKGSVVDSVIGVFLTQNVTDHLSSSAFMSLAARFPPKPSSNREDERNIRSVVVEDPDGCILNLNDTPSWQEMVHNPSDTQVSGVDSGSKEQQGDCSNSGIERFSFLENSSQNLEEEVLSSQDSFEPAIFQSCGRVGSSDAEFSTTRCEAKTASGSAQSVQTGSPSLSDGISLQGNERQLQYERSGDAQIQETANVAQKKPDLEKTMNWKDSLSFGKPSNHTTWQKGPTNPSSSYDQSTIQQPEVLDIEDFGKQSEGMGYSWLPVSPRVDRGKNKKSPRRVVRKGGKSTQESTGQIIPGMGLSASSSTTQNEMNEASQLQKTFMDLLNSSEECLTRQSSSTTQNITDASLQNILVESNSSNKEETEIGYNETNATIVREMKGTLADGKKPTSQWDSLRKDAEGNEGRKERSKDSMDSIDYEAIRRASVKEISDAIKERGMNNMLAVRIKDFLERIVKDHGAVDLEWLRDVPPEKAKDYLLSIRGLGLKSVECVRLLTLHNLAFPVDTNVGRIAVRLGWVPLQPLPESLQLHLLELYPVLESIQKYLWPRLCKLDQRTLYELHYQLITFGKVFCTKSRPNCNACPMRGECRHFASAYASARLSLPAPPPEERSITTATIPVPLESFPPAAIPMMELPPPMGNSVTREALSNRGNCEPIIEEPASPEPECPELTASDIEYAYYNIDPDTDEEIPTINVADQEIPAINVNMKQFGMTLKEVMERHMACQEGDMSRALVTLNPATTSIPIPKLKNISRLRTEHQVYELPDSHPLLDGMDRRERDDPSPYLLAIWTPGETANSTQPPELKCGGQASGKMCFDETCSECNSVREANSQTVRGTLLIPCRTAMRGSFPLNGTYFQVNELFADHDSSLEPINVPRNWIWNLARRTVYFGTSVTSIFRGLSTEQIQYCFWKGFVCVRGFDQKTRAPRPLMARLHFPASKLKTTKT